MSISNGHLERRGIKSSSVKVADNSYTVFNSVIFDLILNIIGSQMPSSGNYMTTAAEEFDEQGFNPTYKITISGWFV